MTATRPKVVMLGWEFPPFITGGLGTACHGLTKALASMDVDVTFVLPKGVKGDHASHVDLVVPGSAADELKAATRGAEPAPAALPVDRRSADRGIAARRNAGEPVPAPGSALAAATAAMGAAAAAGKPLAEAGAHLGTAANPARIHGESALGRTIRMIAAPFVASGAYASPGARTVLERIALASAAPQRLLRPGALASAVGPDDISAELFTGLDDAAREEALGILEAWERYGTDDPTAVAEMVEMVRAVRAAVPESNGRGARVALAGGTGVPDYAGDLLAQSEAYARFVVETCRDRNFDVIHAHDWLTYPAGIALARVTGKPLVVHVHSTEFDRSGEHVNQPVYNIERRGMHAAVKVITVSMLTRNICANRYAVPVSKCEVVYNGVDLDPKAVGISTIGKRDKIVLYFGRITLQKGPEYFVHAAKRVLEKYEDVKFVVAGSGDQAQSMIQLAAELGIGHKVLFTGFLRGKDIPRVFSMADLYVMPSVSEPFGIAPLEALGHRVPVLISRQSGVSEVLTNALKVDFWDVDDMANKIVAVLRHPPLQRTLTDHGFDEVRGITWDGAAERCVEVYGQALAAVGRGLYSANGVFHA
jgi:glycosyltransferase involved in cell wall biosynthesis